MTIPPSTQDARATGLVELAENFHCAICQREICMRWNRPGRETQLPPFCRYCEHQHTQGIGMPRGGSFRDRREVQRGFAISEALNAAAHAKQWSKSHASA